MRRLWLSGGACAMGLGICSMHYIGMLALRLPVEVLYHLPTVGLSLLAAILASGVALFVVSRKSLETSSVLLGGLVMGTGIAGMHYIGMGAMRLPVMCRFDVPLVALSLVIAVVVSLVALWLAFHFRAERPWARPRPHQQVAMRDGLLGQHADVERIAVAADAGAAAAAGRQLRHVLGAERLRHETVKAGADVGKFLRPVDFQQARPGVEWAQCPYGSSPTRRQASS